MAVKIGLKGTASIIRRIRLCPHTLTIAQHVLYYSYLSHIMTKLPDHMTLSNKTSYQTQAFPGQATVKFRIHCGRGFNVFKMQGLLLQ